MILFFGPFNLARRNRTTDSEKYSERFIQGVTYRELNRKERRGKKRHKYEMLHTRTEKTKMVGFRISHRFFDLHEDGTLVIYAGYRWDGPSGPTVDTASFMRGSAIHDVFFQCLREKLFDPGLKEVEWDDIFSLANEELHRFCRVDGMVSIRAWWVYQSVQRFGEKHARPQEEKK